MPIRPLYRVSGTQTGSFQQKTSNRPATSPRFAPKDLVFQAFVGSDDASDVVSQRMGKLAVGEPVGVLQEQLTAKFCYPVDLTTVMQARPLL